MFLCVTDGTEAKAPLTRTSSMTDDFNRFSGKPSHTEKRFFVDRKKLEKLITGMNVVGGDWEPGMWWWGLGGRECGGWKLER